MERIRAFGMSAGATRALLGFAAVLSPRLARRAWHGGVPRGDDSGLALMRALGARDLTLGAATSAAATLGDDQSPRLTAQLLRVGFVSDLTDALTAAASLARPRPSRPVSVREVVAPATLAALGLSGLLATAWTERADVEAPEPDLPGEIRVTIPDSGVDLRDGVRSRP